MGASEESRKRVGKDEGGVTTTRLEEVELAGLSRAQMGGSRALQGLVRLAAQLGGARHGTRGRGSGQVSCSCVRAIYAE